MAIENTPFQTRARTIDHLGREQIADCPTAISELWKNSYDAYARSVELHIFDAEDEMPPVAALVDDGHGMSKNDFINKWLVVGTESKATKEVTLKADRNGLPERPRQGQKGIGRLSCAAMGHLLLLVSKRKLEPYVAALIDWRIFENPFLILNDIEIPVLEFNSKDELILNLPEMFDALMSNVWGSGKSSDSDRNVRVDLAWKTYDEFELSQGKSVSTKDAIVKTIISSSFEARHFDSWPLWKGETTQGTALFISNISDDLLSQLSKESGENEDSVTQATKDKFFETLSGFIDPYHRDDQIFSSDQFTASVTTWHGDFRKIIIDKIAEFNINNLDELEHAVEGEVDENGVFHGKIRVFGKEYPEIVVFPFEPVAKSPSAFVGKFSLHIGTFEILTGNTTHTPEQHAKLLAAADKYAGFKMYRDGFRVMPYGREDNDFFQIEKRRSMNAGVYFWASRRTFGGIRISRDNNPNLRDKAGREGLIDSKATKQFREIAINILVELAKKYFGTNSENRKDNLPKIQADHARQKAEEDRKKLLSSQRQTLKRNIKKNFQPLAEIADEIDNLYEQFKSTSDSRSLESSLELQHYVTQFSGVVTSLDLGPIPSSLGSIEAEYLDYIGLYKRVVQTLAELSENINLTIEKLKPELPGKIVIDEIERRQLLIANRIKNWSLTARKNLSEESSRLEALAHERTKSYLIATEHLPKEAEAGTLALSDALDQVNKIYQTISKENENLFPPYLTALESLREEIDLQNLATYSLKESESLKEEIGRIHALAQLGIAVEIIGHEIEGLDVTIERGLESLPEEIKESRQYLNIISAHHALSDKWRFLSPLKLSGQKIYKNITGTEIYDYVTEFFDDYLSDDIELTATDSFRNFIIKDLPARLYPVFVNLINNARYWVKHSLEDNKKILLDYIDGKIYVSDNGPGVSEDDIAKLFTLFFTKKASGGRGVGLYLCKANLAAAGHNIYYENLENNKLLSGANFVIEFKGIKND